MHTWPTHNEYDCRMALSKCITPSLQFIICNKPFGKTWLDTTIQWNRWYNASLVRTLYNPRIYRVSECDIPIVLLLISHWRGCYFHDLLVVARQARQVTYKERITTAKKMKSDSMFKLCVSPISFCRFVKKLSDCSPRSDFYVQTRTHTHTYIFKLHGGA